MSVTWEVKRAVGKQLSGTGWTDLHELLEEGWEPFCVTASVGTTYPFVYHLRRQRSESVATDVEQA